MTRHDKLPLRTFSHKRQKDELYREGEREIQKYREREVVGDLDFILTH